MESAVSDHAIAFAVDPWSELQKFDVFPGESSTSLFPA